VEVWSEAATLRISVRDNGRGFAQPAPEQGRSANGSGLGLVGMAERVRILGGTHTVVSTPGEGTTIDVQIPLEQSRTDGTRIT
jgi:signal transduction histidine kinase